MKVISPIDKTEVELIPGQVRLLAFFLLKPDIIRFFSAPIHKAKLFGEFVAGLSEQDRTVELGKFHNSNTSILGSGQGGYGCKNFAIDYQKLTTELHYKVREELTAATPEEIDKKCEGLTSFDEYKSDENIFLKSMMEILKKKEFSAISAKLWFYLTILDKFAEDFAKFSKSKKYRNIVSTKKNISHLLPKTISPLSPKIDQKDFKITKTRGLYQSELSVSFVSPTRDGSVFFTEEDLVIHVLIGDPDQQNDPEIEERLIGRGYSLEAIGKAKKKIDVMFSVTDAIFEPKILNLIYASMKDSDLLKYFMLLDPKSKTLWNIFDNDKFSILSGDESPFLATFQIAIAKLELDCKQKLATEEELWKSIKDLLEENFNNCKTDLTVALFLVLVRSPITLHTLLTNVGNLREIADLYDTFCQARLIKIELLVNSILNIEIFKLLYSLCNASDSPIEDEKFKTSFCQLYVDLREKACNKLTKEVEEESSDEEVDEEAVDKEKVDAEEESEDQFSERVIDWEIEDLLDGDEKGTSLDTQNKLRAMLTLAKYVVLDRLADYVQKREQQTLAGSRYTIMPAPAEQDSKPVVGAVTSTPSYMT